MERSIVIETDMLVDWYLRLANVIIDAVAIYVVAILIGVFALILTLIGFDGVSLWLGGLNDRDFQIIGVLLMTAYYVVMEATTQRTVGKFITGTMVIAEDGSKPSVKSILGRSLCRIFTIEAFSFLSAYPRGWHDSASNTYLVKVKKYKAALEIKESFEQIGTEQL